MNAISLFPSAEIVAEVADSTDQVPPETLDTLPDDAIPRWIEMARRKEAEEHRREIDEERRRPVQKRGLMYLPVHLGLCWNCGKPGHDRRGCTNKMILFCSRCGMVGTMSRSCQCRCPPPKRAMRRTPALPPIPEKAAVTSHTYHAGKVLRVSRGTQTDPVPQVGKMRNRRCQTDAVPPTTEPVIGNLISLGSWYDPTPMEIHLMDEDTEARALLDEMLRDAASDIQ